MKKANDQTKKFDRATHVISQLNGKAAPPDIKNSVYPKQEKNSK
ncbi:hypothetical protein Ga0466249_002655 [Sporomusaceae bacterium BoRhaA]|nr:hypothetical protein [Pelorhabdus rhamnosifermentans]MBU2701539.1 hypothetical protein [Pelorhabdus rhamnosifermentans]